MAGSDKKAERTLTTMTKGAGAQTNSGAVRVSQSPTVASLKKSEALRLLANDRMVPSSLSPSTRTLHDRRGRPFLGICLYSWAVILQHCMVSFCNQQPLAVSGPNKATGNQKGTDLAASSTAPKSVVPFAQASATTTALKDISNNATSSAVKTGLGNNWRVAPAAEVVKPAAASGKAGMDAGGKGKAEAAQNYEISDREESSDDDYDSADGQQPAKKVPDWAKGPALREVSGGWSRAELLCTSALSSVVSSPLLHCPHASRA